MRDDLTMMTTDMRGKGIKKHLIFTYLCANVNVFEHLCSYKSFIIHFTSGSGGMRVRFLCY